MDVNVLIGAGSIGQAIARRVSAGKHVLIADLRKENAGSSTASDLDYTILRSDWFARDPEGPYRRKVDPFVGHAMALDSLSQSIVGLATTPGTHARRSLGVSDG